MKLRIFILVLLLLTPLNSALSASPPKAGSNCNKAGITKSHNGKKYFCIKSGKKLIWSREKILTNRKIDPSVSATPVSTPSPEPVVMVTPSPSPSKSFQDSVSQKIGELIQETTQNKDTKTPKLEFIFQGNTSSEIEAKTKRSLENALPIFVKLGFPVSDGLILVARDMTWLKEQLISNSCNYKSLPNRPGFYVPNTCTGLNGAITSFHWESEKFGDGLDGLYFNHVLPHEYFHQIQQKMTTLGNNDFPRWFWEGSAQFFTNQAWSSWNVRMNYREWFNHWWTDLRPDLGPFACRNASISLMSNPSTSGTEGICAYSKGQLIVEYLIYKYGLENYRLLYTKNSYGGWSNFNKVFTEVTGNNLEDFYKEADVFITQRGW